MKWLVSLVWLGVWALGAAQAAPSIPLASHGDTWHYRKGTNAPQADWKTAADAGLDATWATGRGGFGYADNTAETANCQTLLTDMEDHYTTLYLRKQFTITNAVEADLHLMLRMDWDDGYVAWLDGEHLTNAFAGVWSIEPDYDATADTSHESSRGNSSPRPAVTNDLGLASAWLGVGTHTLAIIGLNQTSGSSDCIQIADLYLDLPPVPPPAVTNIWRAADSPVVLTTNVVVANNATFVIEPGVTVALGSGLDITVEDGGRLLAEGTADAPIRFTRSGGSGYWGNLTINGSPGSPESRIAYAEFEFNANSTGTPCIEVARGTAWLDHLTFGNAGAPYVHVDGASFVISHCHFPPATAQFEPCHGTGGIKSGGHGVFLRNFFGKAKGYNDVVDFTGGNRPNQPIVHFIENVVTGSDDDAFDIDGTDAWVEGNIFLHLHKNGSTPDSSSAVSGGNSGSNTSEITVIGNLMYDCDQAATAKQGNFYTMVNNTIVHQTHAGGIDTEGAVVVLADTGTSQGAGIYLEGNIIYDAEQLTRNVTSAIVTFTNNLLPMVWSGPGGGNSTSDPLLRHVPLMSETYFTNWAEAQIMREWFSLLPGSPGIGAGPNGLDLGGVIPPGVSVSGEPSGTTTRTDATLIAGINRSGHGIPAAGWPEGSGYTRYKWRLDGGDWSAETPIATPIALAGLGPGPHYVEVTGKLDSGLYQDDPLFAEDAVPTRSRTWTVAGPPRIELIRLTPTNAVQIEFIALADAGYRIEYRDSLSTGGWQTLAVLDPVPALHAVTFTDPIVPGEPSRFYRLGQ